MNFTIKQCSIDNLYELQKLSYNTFNEAFSHMNTASAMNAYLEKAFNTEKLRSELSDKNSRFYFLYINETLAGYIKLNEAEAQNDIRDSESLEIERIYLSKEFQNKGLGEALLNKAIETANMQKKSYLWLGVWDKNEKAISFYKRNGFYEIGTHPFFMGDEEQNDYIMRKDL